MQIDDTGKFDALFPTVTLLKSQLKNCRRRISPSFQEICNRLQHRQVWAGCVIKSGRVDKHHATASVTVYYFGRIYCICVRCQSVTDMTIVFQRIPASRMRRKL